jgi:hypothetical protein
LKIPPGVSPFHEHDAQRLPPVATGGEGCGDTAIGGQAKAGRFGVAERRFAADFSQSRPFFAFSPLQTAPPGGKAVRDNVY